jgi:hypothetical protein
MALHKALIIIHRQKRSLFYVKTNYVGSGMLEILVVLVPVYNLLYHLVIK